jgi:23S rRNA (guanosine2251-2'-O)-methyltransferase
MNKIYGRKPVLEAIKSGIEIEQIYISFGTHGDVIEQIKREAKRNGVKITQAPPAKFDSLFRDKNTQGVAAITSDINYCSLDELISISKKSEYPLLLILDSIQDTHNLGAILRSAECAGVDGVIVTSQNSAPINEVVEKTSAGAVNYLKITKAGNLNNVITVLKEEGFWIVGSSLGANSKPYSSIDYKMPVAIIVGNEEKGIRRLIADNCDFLAAIPMSGKIQSLNVSVATGILLFEIQRQRNK